MKNKLALTTIIGLVGGVACVAIAIAEAGNLSLFINIPSLLIIVGGTAFAVVMSYPIKNLLKLGAVIKQAFTKTDHDLIEDIGTITELSDTARREGLLSLESYMEECADRFLKKGLALIIDGINREEFEGLMLSEIYRASRRHNVGISMVSMIASLTPALGLVGTYVGLIPMLVHMTDPDKLGPMMAIELVSSFYGGFLAYVIFSPMAKKLQDKSLKEKDRNEMLLEGMIGILEGRNPRHIREELSAYLTDGEILELPDLRHAGVAPATDSKVIDYKETKSNRKLG